MENNLTDPVVLDPCEGTTVHRRKNVTCCHPEDDVDDLLLQESGSANSDDDVRESAAADVNQPPADSLAAAPHDEHDQASMSHQSATILINFS